jgi:PAS domain S-box-containing protein
VVLLAIELVSHTPYKMPNPGSFFFTIVVYSAINNGLRAGLLSALVAWLYSAYYFGGSFIPSSWSSEQRQRLILQAINLPLIAILVGVLQNRATHLRELRLDAEWNERSLRQSRDWLATTLQSMGDAVISTDAIGRITFLNPAASELTGWSQAAAANRPLEDVFSIFFEKTGEPAPNPARRALDENTVVSLANGVMLRARDGREIPIDDSAAPVRDSAGKALGAVVVFRDVSARKAAAQALARNETLFRATVEESPIAILICAPDGSVIRTNRAWENLYQVSRSELDDYNLRHDPQLAELGMTPLIERAFAGESIVLPLINYDPAKIGKPGHACWIQTLIYPVKDSHDAMTEVVLMIEDVSQRVNTMNALRQSEQRYQSLVHASAQIVWTTPADGAVEDMPMWRDFTGQTLEKVCGWGWLEAIHPDDRDVTAEAWKKAVAARTNCDVEYRVRRHDGIYRLFSTRGVPVLNDAGEIREWVGSCIDITEQKRDAALLSGQTRVLEKVARGEDLDETLRVLADGIQAQSKAICAIMLREGETLRLVAAPLLPPAFFEATRMVPIGEGCGSCGTAVARGETVASPDISTDPLWDICRDVVEPFGIRACWSQPIFDAAQRTIGTFAMYQKEVGEPDAGDRQLIEAAADLAGIAITRANIERDLRAALARETETAAHLGAILRHVADGVIVADSEGRIAFSNNVACQLHGVESVGETLEEYVRIRPRYKPDGERMEPDSLPITRAWKGIENVEHEEWQIERPDGSRIWVQGSAAQLRDEDGTLRGAVLTLHDVSDARRVVEELQHASRMKDEFLAVLSHELRTPLTPILGWISLLRRTRDGGPGSVDLFDQAVDSIERNAELQKRLVNDLLDTSRIISGKLHIETHQADFNALATLAARTVEGAISERGIRLSTKLDARLPQFAFDSERVQQVLMNLLSNAAKFSPDNELIEMETVMETRPNGISYARATVRDRGEGIDLEFLPHVFDVFRQGDASFTRRHGGLGLGLAIARSFIELHGGSIEAHSDGPGTGATFSFWLPLNQAGTPAAP